MIFFGVNLVPTFKGDVVIFCPLWSYVNENKNKIVKKSKEKQKQKRKKNGLEIWWLDICH